MKVFKQKGNNINANTPNKSKGFKQSYDLTLRSLFLKNEIYGQHKKYKTDHVVEP